MSRPVLAGPRLAPTFSADELAAEEWRPVAGFDGYDASDLGRVRSWRKAGRGFGTRREWPLLLSAYTDRCGYAEVRLYFGGKPVKKKVHVLVLLAFVGPRPARMQTRHFPDRTRTNNRLSNLSYGTAVDNSDDKVEHGTLAQGDSHGRTKMPDAACEELRAGPAGQDRFRAYASEFGVTVDHVSRVYHGRSRSVSP